MSLTLEQIRTAALQLDPREREALAEELLLSINGADRDAIDAAWRAEARRRDADLRAGKSQLRPMDEVIDRLKFKPRS